jgi:DNA transposition AAA+ family ATPase
MYLEQHARARAASLSDRFLTTTKVARDMLTVARLVRENETLGLVMGPSGIGKSRCAMAIQEKYVGSVYVSVMRDYHHPKGLTRKLAIELGVRGQHTCRHNAQYTTQLERVIDTLRDSHRLLIIDEAAKLTDPAVELLRDIHDNTGVPILLIATRDLHERIVSNADPDHGQLYSRFDVIHHLTEGYDVNSGGKVLHTMDHIRELYTDPPVRLANDATRYLQGVANDLGRGSLRRCKMLLRNAVRRARKRQGLSEGEKVIVTGDDLEWVETRLRQESSEQEAVKDRRRRAVAAMSG